MNKSDAEEFQYQPGVCNIDSSGVRWRKRLGYICLAAWVLSLAIMYSIHFGVVFRVLIDAGFGYMTALNFIQAKEHFCAMNASKRTYEISLRRMKITDDTGKDKDLKKMR